MVAAMILVADEVADLRFKVSRQIVVLEQDAVLERLMPALDLALRPRVQGSRSARRLATPSTTPPATATNRADGRDGSIVTIFLASKIVTGATVCACACAASGTATSPVANSLRVGCIDGPPTWFMLLSQTLRYDKHSVDMNAARANDDTQSGCNDASYARKGVAREKFARDR